MDFALLYYGDLFEPHYDEPGRRYLYIEGLLYRRGKPMRRGSGRVVRPTRTDTIGLVLCSDTRMAEWVVRDLREERPGVKLLVAGRTSSLAPGAFGLRDALERPARLGRGNVRRRGGWQMRDRILADTALRTSAGDVYARRYLIDPKTGTPLPTYEKGGTGAATATPCRYSFTWSRFFGIPEKFLYIRIPNGEYEFFDEAVTGMSPQFSSVKSSELTKNL